MRWGTSYFASKHAAIAYYKRQHETADDVDRKLEEGLINIGYPPLKDGERCHLNSEGRYEIETKD